MKNSYNMKKLLTFAIFLIFAVTTFAQNDVTQFLGIPVDGTKSEMIGKLKAKGFTPTSYDKEILTGEFNGRDVEIHVVTNNNKVYRIYVEDRYAISEEQIKIRFNKLCEQFYNNGKYFRSGSLEDLTIPEDEDISYNIIVGKKSYRAGFFQVDWQPLWQIGQNYEEIIKKELLSKYTEEELKNPTDQIEKDREIIKEEIARQFAQNTVMKRVWFQIGENNGKYYIAMYYDNKYNQANGEDL